MRQHGCFTTDDDEDDGGLDDTDETDDGPMLLTEEPLTHVLTHVLEQRTPK